VLDRLVLHLILFREAQGILIVNAGPRTVLAVVGELLGRAICLQELLLARGACVCVEHLAVTRHPSIRMWVGLTESTRMRSFFSEWSHSTRAREHSRRPLRRSALQMITQPPLVFRWPCRPRHAAHRRRDKCYQKRPPPANGGGVTVQRGHACVESRRAYSATGPPTGSSSESAGRDRWPPPSGTTAFDN
jgi:hypothetical protein